MALKNQPQPISSLVKRQNWRAITQELSQERKNEIEAYREKYGEWSNFFSKFGADKQTTFAEHPEGCYLGSAPSLIDLKFIYGKEQMRLWLATQLNHACMCLGRAFVGSDIPKNPIMTEYVNSLCINYSALKLTEWMLFFFRLRSGRYGKIYGDLTPDYMADALKMFLMERNNDLDMYERKLKQSTKEESKNCCTYEEYLRMKEAGEIEYIASEN